MHKSDNFDMNKKKFLSSNDLITAESKILADFAENLDTDMMFILTIFSAKLAQSLFDDKKRGE